jgi:hypothetical protein
MFKKILFLICILLGLFKIDQAISSPILYGEDISDIGKWNQEKFIDWYGVKKPTDTQKAIFLALEATKKNNPVGPYLIARLSYWVRLPVSYQIAWYKYAMKSNSKDSYFLDEFKRLEKKSSVIDKKSAEQISNIELITETEKFLVARRNFLGRLEPRDLIDEGWIQFVGYRGYVNEPLAQLLIEEGLRLAIAKNDKYLIADARNNLGVIFINSFNKNIRNPRLAKIHFMDAFESDYAPYNLLWLSYVGQIQLTNEEREKLQQRYISLNKERDIFRSLDKPPQEFIGKPKLMLKFLISQYNKYKKPELAMAVADYIEDNNETFNINEAINWYSKFINDTVPDSNIKYGWNEDEYPNTDAIRLERLKIIKAGKYQKDMPVMKDAVNKIFSINLEEDSKSNTGIKNINSTKLFALIIGNSKYKNNYLKTPESDADKVSKELESMGFYVINKNNLKKNDFALALLNFSEVAKNSEVTVVYYSGHGIQMGGINYLLPVDFDFNSPKETITFNGINMNDILRQNIPGKSRIIFLDACRNNPYDNTKGLAPINEVSGTLISYATRDGSVAYDGINDHMSPYSEALIRHIHENEDIAIILRNIRADVKSKTSGKQEPWEYGDLGPGKFILSKLTKHN